MTLDTTFNFLYTHYKFQKTLKNSNLIDRKKQQKQLSNK